MHVVIMQGENFKMFGKNKIDGKFIDKDVGFAEDAFELLKQSCGVETHCLGNFQNTGSNEDLEEMNSARAKRTELMQIIIESVGAELKNQRWCQLKHTCNTAMHIQELIARASNLGNLEVSKRLVAIHQEYYLDFLEILGFTEKNSKSKTSA